MNLTPDRSYMMSNSERGKQMSVRVRFAPSPTGYLHVGGARTALYNWLFARHLGGVFVLRIEDTDRARSTEQAIDQIVEAMNWLGLDWDESPRRQTDNLDAYLSTATSLVEQGQAYHCYCSPEELRERRLEAKAKGESPGYDRRCRHLSAEEQAACLADGRRPSVRFKIDIEGETVVDDLVRGRVVFGNSELDDLIIMRPDGIPTYNFAAVIDDHEMGITHVIRGEDHLSNTPKQIQIYRALGAEPPVFAHLSMILGADKTPLSKRHGATSVEAFRDHGYLPEAMINFLALLGWAWDDHTTIFSLEELIEKFTLEKVTKSPAVFDTAKLDWLNGQYIRELSEEELTQRLIPIWRSAGLLSDTEVGSVESLRLRAMAAICQERLGKLTDIVELTDFFFRPVTYDPVALRKGLEKEGARAVLGATIEKLAGLSDWKTTAIDVALRELAEELDEKPRKVFQPIRVAVSGRLVSPPLFETLEILGPQETAERLRAAQEVAST